MYFVNTQDLLMVILAGGVVFLVIFLCLVLYELFKVLKNVEEITKNVIGISQDVSHTSNLITQGIDALSHKITHFGELLSKLAPIIKDAFKSSRRKKNK